MGIILQAKNLCKTYQQGDVTIQALKDVSIEIMIGDFIAITGKSGCGKSTLLHILGGLDKPNGGSVFINGIDITFIKENELCIFRRSNIGFMFQFFNLIPELNVRENILYPVWLDGKKEDKDYIDNIIDILQIGDRLNHLPDQLSGGQQQRVALARALSNKPKIMLCDEPTGNLDNESSDVVISMLQSIQTKLNQTLIIVTHDLDIAAKATKCINLKDGMVE